MTFPSEHDNVNVMALVVGGMVGLDELVDEAMAAYRQLCAGEGIDPEAELAEARFAHDTPVWEWVAARLQHAPHRREHPRSTFRPGHVDKWLNQTRTKPDRAPLAAALYIANGPNCTDIARNTTDPRLLTALIGHPAQHIRASAAGNQHTPATALGSLETGEERRNAAFNPSLTPELIDMLAADRDPTVRAIMACNPALPEHWARTLAADPVFDVRFRIACRTDIPADIVETLAADRDTRVRLQMAGNPSATRVLLERLTADPNDVVAGSAQLRLNGGPPSRRR